MPDPPVKPIFKNTWTLEGEIPFESIQENLNVSVTQENLTTLTSYNLLEKHKRTIVVPGSPPIWKTKELPAKVKADAGKFFSDPVRHIFPKSPMEPFFRALSITKPDFNLNNVDFITDRRNLRLLLGFVGGATGEFRIDVEVIKATLIFSCWLKNTTTIVRGFQGYGREFERAFTHKPRSVKGNVTHNRAINYTLGGLRMVVRFEVDGYIDGTLPAPASTTQGTFTGPSHALMKQSSVLQTPTGFTVAIRGQFIPPHRIIEIKTGSQGKNLSSKAMDQMWFSQTPILCGGHYENDGIFSSVTEVDIVQEGGLARWEEENKGKLRKLVRVLEKIGEVVRRVPGRKCAIIHPGRTRVLKVYNVTNGDTQGLPADILAKWDI